MRYRLRQKIWAIRDRFIIRSAFDEELYAVEGEFWTIGKKLTITDIQGRVLARIEQKLITLRPTFFIYRDGAPTVRVRRMLWPIFKPRYEIEVPGQKAIVVRGSFWMYEFKFQRGRTLIGTVSKKVFSWADSYCVDLREGEDQLLLLAATVIIDLCNCASANSGSSG